MDIETQEKSWRKTENGERIELETETNKLTAIQKQKQYRPKREETDAKKEKQM